MEKEKKRGRDIENKELEEPVEEGAAGIFKKSKKIIRSPEQRIAEKERNKKQGAVGIFKKSKKIIRSPEQRIAEKERNKKQQQPCVSSENRENRENSESMEELKELMKQIIRDMAQNTSDLKEEIREIKQEMKNKEERWELEKHQLMERVEILENKLEIGEKLKRKNNIVLKGVRITEGAERQEVENFLATKLQIPTRIEKARVLNNDKRFPIVVAEVGTYDEKQKIMRGKNKLKGTTIYIDNDLTREESSHWEQRKQEIAVKAPKMMKIGTWNVRSANEEGTIKHIMAAMKRYGIQILALQETKQKGNEIINLGDFTIFNSGGTHTRHFGTAFIVSKLWSERVVDFKPITDRLCLIRLRGDYRKISLINCHAPTEEKEIEEKDLFYERVDRTMNEIPNKLKEYRKLVRQSINLDYQNYLHSVEQSVKSDPKKLWSYINEKKKQTRIPGSMMKDGHCIETPILRSLKPSLPTLPQFMQYRVWTIPLTSVLNYRIHSPSGVLMLKMYRPGSGHYKAA
ncbi:hypothetical protein QE152_g4251 [Popillia japonica]|uniref:Endonuclease/exonuclease/phosphatase domain-containing protein n=1 Tax=Popillia japonica TaxID=7064 RepID=A0AAW1N1E5_POPJA